MRRFQIDYILVKQRFRNPVKDCKNYPGADISSDHNLIAMKCQLKFKFKQIPPKGGRGGVGVKKCKFWPLGQTQPYFAHIICGPLEG